MPSARTTLRNAILLKVARKFRGGRLRNRTESERVFEGLLRQMGLGFVPQAIFFKPASTFYIADFYLTWPHKLVVEIDGRDHRVRKRRLRDNRKDSYFRAADYRWLRLSNDVILRDITGVKKILEEVLHVPDKKN